MVAVEHRSSCAASETVNSSLTMCDDMRRIVPQMNGNVQRMTTAADISGTENSPASGWVWSAGDLRPLVIEPGRAVSIVVRPGAGPGIDHRALGPDGEPAEGAAVETLHEGEELQLGEGERRAFWPHAAGGCAATLGYTRPEERPAGRTGLPRRGG